MTRVRVGTLSEFADGRLHSLDAGGTTVIVGQVGEALYAARNRCPHLGFSLTTGPGGMRFSDGEVQCPWHNSRFDLCTGENRDWTPGFAGQKARAADDISRRRRGRGRVRPPVMSAVCHPRHRRPS
jgi:nitrite reductase/ring-hydroxylating ferredoxin subunit